MERRKRRYSSLLVLVLILVLLSIGLVLSYMQADRTKTIGRSKRKESQKKDETGKWSNESKRQEMSQVHRTAATTDDKNTKETPVTEEDGFVHDGKIMTRTNENPPTQDKKVEKDDSIQKRETDDKPAIKTTTTATVDNKEQHIVPEITEAATQEKNDELTPPLFTQSDNSQLSSRIIEGKPPALENFVPPTDNLPEEKPTDTSGKVVTEERDIGKLITSIEPELLTQKVPEEVKHIPDFNVITDETPNQQIEPELSTREIKHDQSILESFNQKDKDEPIDIVQPEANQDISKTTNHLEPKLSADTMDIKREDQGIPDLFHQEETSKPKETLLHLEVIEDILETLEHLEPEHVNGTSSEPKHVNGTSSEQIIVTESDIPEIDTAQTLEVVNDNEYADNLNEPASSVEDHQVNMQEELNSQTIDTAPESMDQETNIAAPIKPQRTIEEPDNSQNITEEVFTDTLTTEDKNSASDEDSNTSFDLEMDVVSQSFSSPRRVPLGDQVAPKTNQEETSTPPVQDHPTEEESGDTFVFEDSDSSHSFDLDLVSSLEAEDEKPRVILTEEDVNYDTSALNPKIESSIKYQTLTLISNLKQESLYKDLGLIFAHMAKLGVNGKDVQMPEVLKSYLYKHYGLSLGIKSLSTTQGWEVKQAIEKYNLRAL